MESTQDYLRHCLQIAQEYGFLDLILQNKDATPPPSTPQMPTPQHHHSDLAALIDTAKLNGWYIAPDEVHHSCTILLKYLVQVSPSLMEK